jgi:hypothetical protein
MLKRLCIDLCFYEFGLLIYLRPDSWGIHIGFIDVYVLLEE